MQREIPATVSGGRKHLLTPQGKPPLRIHCRLFLIAMLFAATAEASTLSMDYSLGFNSRFEIDKWTPLTVVLENRGRAKKGVLEVVVTSGSEYRKDVHRRIYSADLELPYNSKQLRSFTIFIDSPSHDLILRFRAGDEILVSHSIRLLPYYSTKALAVVLDPAMAPDFLSVFPEKLLAVSTRSVDLPETWFGYDGVEMLILNGEILNRLRDSQFAALTRWIRQGGYLVTAAGANYGHLAGKRMQHLLPVTVHGHRKFVELHSFEKFSGRKLKSPEPFLILDVRIEDSTVLLSEGGLPLIVQKEIGNGRIVFLSFDLQNPPFNRWEVRQAFWERMLSLKPAPKEAFVDLADQKILDSMVSSIDARFPGFLPSFLFVSTYLCLVGFIFKRLEKRKGSRRTQVVSLMLSIAAFIAAGYGGFLLPSGRMHLTYNSFFRINLTDRGMNVSGRYIIGLYATRDAPFTVGFGSSQYPISHLLYDPSGAKPPDRYVVSETDSGPKISGYSKRWSHHFLKMDAPLTFPVGAEALLSGNSLHVAIDNPTRHRITDCLAYFDGRFLPLGDVGPNEKKKVAAVALDPRSTNRSAAGETEKLLAHLETSGVLRLSTDMRSRLTGIVVPLVASKYKFRQDVLFLIGWIRSGIIEAVLHGDGDGGTVHGEDLTMINWEIPVKRI